MHEYSIINLDRRFDRFEDMSAEMQRQNLKYRFVAAVDGAKLDWFKADFYYPSAAIKACSMSHQTAVNLYATSWILEDDLQLCNHFDAAVNQFVNDVPNDWDILYLGFTPILQSEYQIVNDRYFHLKNYCPGAWAYKLRGNALVEYRRLLDKMSPDAALTTLQQQYKAYCSYPFLARVKDGFSDTNNMNCTFKNIDQYFKP